MNFAAGRRAALFSTIACTFAVNTAMAAENAMETITVTAARVERSLAEIAGTVTVISAKTIEENLNRDIRDLIRYEPGISVSGGGRFANKFKGVLTIHVNISADASYFSVLVRILRNRQTVECIRRQNRIRLVLVKFAVHDIADISMTELSICSQL